MSPTKSKMQPLPKTSVTTNRIRAVLIADVHFNEKNIELAAAALLAAVHEANILRVPLIIAGDLNDTKSIIRGECLNRIIGILLEAEIQVYVLIGNHDRLNEKAPAHSLEFLKYLPNVTVVDQMIYCQSVEAYLLPYYHNTDDLREDLRLCHPGSDLIIHQGVMGAFMGEYIVDKSSIEPEAFAGFRVISGHYHRAQMIITDGKKHAGLFEVGTFHYIGTPYSITQAEANDGLKGIRILTDESLTLKPLYFRKHRKIECRWDKVMGPFDDINSDDILWLQVSGPSSELDKLKKKDIGLALLGHQNFKLDLIPDTAEVMDAEEIKTFTDEELLDKLIDDSEETKEAKEYLKTLWRQTL